MVHVKQEPSLLPGLDPAPSLGQEACTASRRQPQVRAGGHSVTQRLQVGAEVEVWREEEGQLLETHTRRLDVVRRSQSIFHGNERNTGNIQRPFIMVTLPAFDTKRSSVIR